LHGGGAKLAALHDVTVDYGDRQALGPVSMELEAGTITALVGPSGCGKSTALRLLAGLESPTGGEVVRTPGPGETSVVFQDPTLMPWASAGANVALPLKLQGMADAEAMRRAHEALARVGLAEAAGLKPAQLSGGMAMRVSLARALVTGPRLLLLDEPFAALDEITRRQLAEDIHGLWAETRPAVVFVTHNVEEAVYMAGRVVVLTRGPGRIQAETQAPGELPRPAGFRVSDGFRRSVEQVSAELADGLAPAA
jgi:NitT/TauT family transport system ATP-binding protein